MSFKSLTIEDHVTSDECERVRKVGVLLKTYTLKTKECLKIQKLLQYRQQTIQNPFVISNLRL